MRHTCVWICIHIQTYTHRVLKRTPHRAPLLLTGFPDASAAPQLGCQAMSDDEEDADCRWGHVCSMSTGDTVQGYHTLPKKI